jgi:hypothetical protein
LAQSRRLARPASSGPSSRPSRSVGPGSEIGDKCNFVYQHCVSLGGYHWQIQAEWSNAINGCAQGN